MAQVYLGMISGTSVDGVDAVLVELEGARCTLIAAQTTAYPPALRQRVINLIEVPEVALAELGAVDVALGRFFADCALALLRSAGRRPEQVRALGHHGQTVFHKPAEPEPFTLQIGDPNSIAALTGITTVADFRRLDMALGGQGAPMVPAFHEAVFSDPNEPRIVLNIGGIANVTSLVPGEPTLGFDTGPGNTLLDLWISRSRGQAYDRNGALARAGSMHRGLLERLLDEPYFKMPAPKSTGRELFNAAWLDARLAHCRTPLDPADVQSTLAELTVRTIADATAANGLAPDRVIVCGGGAHNGELLQRLAHRFGVPVESSAAYGIEPDWVEGAAFAWLAAARLEEARGNVPTVTGARQAAVLGGVYCGVKMETASKYSSLSSGHSESKAP